LASAQDLSSFRFKGIESGIKAKEPTKRGGGGEGR